MTVFMTRRAFVATTLALMPLAAQARSPQIYTGPLASVGAGVTIRWRISPKASRSRASRT